RPGANEVIAAAHPAAPPPLTIKLQPQARPRRRLLPFVTFAIAAGAAIGIGAWSLSRDSERALPPLPDASVPRAAKIAIAPVIVTMPSYGNEQPVPPIIAKVVAMMLDAVQGPKLSGVAVGGDRADAKEVLDVKADYFASATVVERG